MPNALGWRLGHSNDTPLPGNESSALGRGRQLVRLLRAHRERPRRCRTAEQRDELAAFQLIELHEMPRSRKRITGYQIGEEQSGGNGTTFLRAER